MRLNPHIQYYSTVYVVSMGAVLLLKTMRGLVFVKVSTLHRFPLRVPSLSVTYSPLSTYMNNSSFLKA